MDTTTTSTKVLGPRRIAALVLVALAAGGLGAMKLTHGTHVVSVPKGAHAGKLTLHGCTVGTELGPLRADCGTLVVPENRHDPHSRLIALPVTRIHARSGAHGVPLFRLEGGPGISNMHFAAASRFATTRDVVLVGYRGVDGSSRLDCPEVVSSREHAGGLLTESAYRADATAFAACASRLERHGVDLAGYSLPERVDDLDAARRALGYPRIDLLSESAGTRTALIYSWRYPQRIHRSVMVGANPPGNFLWDARTTGEQLHRYAAVCAADASCRGRTPDLDASLRSAFADPPGRWLFLPVEKGNVRAGAFFGLMNATSEAAPLSGPLTIGTLLSGTQGDGSGAWLLSVMSGLVFPRAQVWGDVAAVGRSDAAAARQFFAAHRDRGSIAGAPGTDLVWAGGRLLGAWPANPDENEYTTVRDSATPTLLVGGALDLATPPQNATRELLPHLRNGRQVVLRNIGHTDDFWTQQKAAGTHLIDTFLSTGRVDASRYTSRPLDFTPTLSDGDIATIVLAAMLALVGVAAVTLVWLPLRLRRRGAFGPKATVALRAVHALVVGLGGWVAGALIVLTALPTVPLTDEVLGVVAGGVPVALVAYLAAARAGLSARTRTSRLAATSAAALVGAWLGFHAAGPMLAPLTGIVGAAAAANLVLLVLDILHDRPAPEAAPAAEAFA